MHDKGHAREILLVGSVGLGSEEEVFRTASALMGPYLRRIPDGEILITANGERSNRFTLSQRAVMEAHPAFEVDPEEAEAGGRITRGTETARKRKEPRFRVRPGADPADIIFGGTGHADWAQASYAVFKRLKQAGDIAPETRFQVAIPTTAAVLNAHVVTADHPRVEAPYRRALLAEVDRIAAAIPHDELTIQWDVSTEMAQWEGVRDAWFGNNEPELRSGILDRLAIHADRVPADVELGIHLCYGNFGRKHWMEPKDTANMVAVYNGLSERVARNIDYVHMPVPIDRDDDEYYAPLADMKLRPETMLYLGLVHEQDGIEGTRRRMAAAARHRPGFGIATECGFAHRPSDALPDLMRLHSEIAAA